MIPSCGFPRVEEGEPTSPEKRLPQKAINTWKGPTTETQRCEHESQKPSAGVCPPDPSAGVSRSTSTGSMTF